MSTTELKKKKREFPHTFVILGILGLVAMALTWIIPAGAFDRVVNEMGRTVVVPGSFHFIEATPQGFKALMGGIHSAGVATASICMFIFLNVAAFNIINDTGAINAGLAKVSYRMRGKEKLMIPVLMIVFSLASSVIGMAEEGYPFIPIIVAAALALGFDSFTGVLIVILACSAGFTGGMLCPFTVGLAQGIAELPPLSGIGLRLCLHITILTVMIIFVWRYASKIKKNPELSISYETDKEQREALMAAAGEEKPLTGRDKGVLTIFILGMCYFVYGVVKIQWGFADMAACFLVMGILCGLVSGMSLNEICKSMIRGVEGIAYLALLLCFSRVVLLMLENGQVLDTILYYAAEGLNKLPTGLAAIGMYILQCLMSLVVGASSTHATLTMPLMVPLADMVGITRQTAVLAWQMGDSLSNVWLPTSYSVIAMGMAKVPWSKYFKWYLPCMAIQYVIGAIFVLIAVAIGYGPF